MSKFQCQIFVICALSLAICVSRSYAQTISSAELIERDKAYDGKTVVYSGEVIGDVMRRGDFAWVNINDGLNAIGVWMPASAAKEIAYTGSFKSRGDVLKVTGVFRRTCREHGGDLDIHSQAVVKLCPGKRIITNVNPERAKQALILLGALVLVWILTLLRRR